MALFPNYPAPDPHTSFDTDLGRAWAAQLTKFVQNVAKLGDQQVFTGLNFFNNTVRVQKGTPLLTVPGTFPGTATSIFYSERVETADPNVIKNLWAVQGSSFISGRGNAQSTALGGFFQGYVVNGGGVTTWGIATEAVTEAAATVSTTLVGGEFGIISQINNNINPLIGCYVVFKNRHDGVLSVVNGVGANLYNNNSRAIQIAAIGRSTAGEFCGWSSGIFFDTGCMDNVLGGVSAILIDAHRVPASRALIGLWVANDVTNRLSDTSNVGEVYRSIKNQIVWTNGPVDWFGVDMNTGQHYISCPTAGFASAGIIAVPALCAGFEIVNINGINFKRALYGV
jgi:hypothetical protein